MRLKTTLLLAFIFACNLTYAQPSRAAHISKIATTPDTIVKEVSLLFIGDVMGHGSQIKGAYYDSFYDYKPVFQYVKPIIEGADIALANLELTHAGPPYKGYPQFSSPDSLSAALKWAGVDMLVTANNHSCDRRKQGVERTITVLNQYDIPHTGTFKSQAERDSTYPLIMEKNGINMAFLNYTYGTNGIPASSPNIVNLIDKEQIKKDMAKAKSKKVDAIIVVMHWGLEYQRTANKEQRELAEFCFEQGATMVIGSHPHVIQEFERYKYPNDSIGREVFVCYSLGNFVSNQNDLNTRGGAMARVTLKKTITNNDTSTVIGETNYYTTWVHRPVEEGIKRFYILPAATYSNDSSYFKSRLSDMPDLNAFIKSTSEHLNKVNVNVAEAYANTKCEHLDSTQDSMVKLIPGFKELESSDSIYRIVIKLGQHKNLRDDIWCKDVLKKIDWSSENNDTQITLGPFATREEAQTFIKTYSDCLKGYNLRISVTAKP